MEASAHGLLWFLPREGFFQNISISEGHAMRLKWWLLSVVATTTVANVAGAIPIEGEFNVAGSLRVTSSTVDFLNGTSEGTGTFVTLEGGSGYFATIASTNIASPYVGQVKDIAPTDTDVADFLSGFTAPGYTGLTVDLERIESPTAPACTGSEAANTACSLGYLTLTNLGGSNTAMAFVVSGSAEDANVPDSLNSIVGRYTTQTGQSIGDVISAFNGTGITASYSANFEAEEVSEPGVLMLLGIGLAASGMLRRKRA
jgi:hypothetical protein